MKGNYSKILILQITFLLAIFLSSSTVIATNGYEASAVSIIYKITPDEVAAYNLTVTNHDAVEKVYSIGLNSGDATNWILAPSSIKVPANSSSSEVVNIFPKTTTGVGVYSLTIIVGYQGLEQKVTLPLSMNFEGVYTDFTPNVGLTVTAPEVQDPRETMKVSVLMKNRNMLDMKNVTLRISSDLFFKEINTTLGPRKEKTSEVLFDLDPLQAPGVYKVRVDVYYPITDKIVSESDTEVKISTYSAITPAFVYSNNWFIHTTKISLENIGNYERTKEIAMIMPWYKRMFTSADTESELVRIDGRTNMQWNPSVKPMETKVITITTNYRLIFIAIFLLILAIVLYFVLRNPVVLLKEAGVIEEDEHGISEIKVKVFIKNRSRKSLEQLTITDKIPGITEYVESNNLGSLKPSRITKTTAKGTILHWDLDKLDAFEERIITYKLRSKLKIVGDVSLPRIRTKFTYGAGKRERFVISPVPLFFRK